MQFSQIQGTSLFHQQPYWGLYFYVLVVIVTIINRCISIQSLFLHRKLCYSFLFLIVSDCCVTYSWLFNAAPAPSKISHSWTGWTLKPESSWHSVLVTGVQKERNWFECCQLLVYLAFSRGKKNTATWALRIFKILSFIWNGKKKSYKLLLIPRKYHSQFQKLLTFTASHPHLSAMFSFLESQ